ncbi:putative ATPase [Tumebacillus sp. BK434]|uniref:protein kinase domain-containing protein n=1 Tax=Tumebacillus sp. BK434 TaxID=2512169 RepID=UPI00104C4973|nr:AAA family ATPase [Tumebacillus sp. BK434]TCP58968.1 putative ATPase [Tumebacillus sp. BK434]
MYSIAGYQITRKIAEGSKSVIYRGRAADGGQTAILKAMKTEYPPLQDVIRWRREYEIAAGLDCDGIVRPLTLCEQGNGVVLVLEDFGGQSLAHLLRQKRLNLTQFLDIAISLAETLGFLHQRQIIHKDIKPHNIIVAPEQGIVKLTDFSIASLLISEKTEMVNPQLLEGTPAYMSPEQTGRMNRVTDYRTDFYSLGVTFYEMLTGQPPYVTADPVELIHCHIAKQPQAPYEWNIGIPKAVSDIVMRCLAKNAEDRYQSAFGLKADLETCRRRMQEYGVIGDFPLGRSDQSEIFRIPEKLYGRGQDIAAMRACFDRAAQGTSELLLVSGFSGIGKSFFVHEIHASVVQENGFFLTGKFDQFTRHIPFHALIQSMKNLIAQLLTQSEEDIQRWQDTILQALGNNGAVITDVIPELELIIGSQSVVQQLPPEETQNRFQLTMQKLLSVFCKREHPVVLFLDDLQWADPASLTTIEYLLSDAASSHLLCIGAYRDNEVTAGHRLMRMLDLLDQKQRPYWQITLRPLRPEHMGELLADTLGQAPEQVQRLTELVLQKTNGNPFFARQFLQALHARQMISFDSAAGRWVWDEAQIGGVDITDNVVEFMLQKIQELQEDTQQMLQVAACIGSSFDLQTLAHTAGKSVSLAADELWPALQEGLLVPVGTDYKLLYSQGRAEGEEFNVSFKFLHDRVQQAAYALLTEARRKEVHLGIGRLLLACTAKPELEERLFDMVNHLNEGVELIQSRHEQMQLVRLNLIAGKRAKASTAYEPALKYLAQGAELLPDDAWDTHYDLTLELNLERSEVEYLCGNFELAERLFDLILANAKTKLEQVRVYHIKTQLLINLGQYEEAIRQGLKSVRLLGIKLNDETGIGSLLWELMKAKWNLRKRTVTELLHLPLVKDPYRDEAMKQVFNIATAFYFVNPQQFALLNLKVLNMTVKHGNSLASSIAYGGYGVMIGNFLGDVENGYRYGKLARQVNDKYYAPLRHKSDFSFALFSMHWKEHLQHAVRLFRETHQNAMESGDLIQAFFSVLQMINCMVIHGEQLTVIDRDVRTYLEFAKRAKLRDHVSNYLILKAFVQNLLGRTDGLMSLTDEDFQEDAYLARLQAEEGLHQLNWYYMVKTKLCYLYEQPGEAVRWSREAEQIISASMAQPHVPEHYFYDSLSLAADYGNVPAQEQRAYWKKLKKNLRKLKKWARHAPHNTEHKYMLVRAEMERLKGSEQEAMRLYDLAIESATLYEFANNAALAAECAAKFYAGRGTHKIAKTYMTEAVYGYLRWGAVAKVKQLEARYPHLLATRLEHETSLEVAAAGESSISATGGNAVQKIDLLTVMKAARAISGEIVLEKLLENMIHIVVENAGAEKGVLLIEQGGDLLIEAEKSTGDDAVRVLQGTPYRNSANVAPSVIQYVRRMREPVVLHDAADADMFAKDPYLLLKKPKSLLAMPIVNQGRLVGVLYLENNLTTHAFTASRLEVMSLLSSQIAVSIENAKLYNQQVELSRAYGKFVPHQFLRFLEKKSIIDVRLGDHVQTEMTVLFSDIRSFTTLSERMTPEENFKFLNDFLSRMEPSITENHGFIDKFIGDSIMSLFDQSADDAVRAALSMLKALTAFNEQRRQRGAEEIGLGIGINSGLLMLGTLGGDNRMDSTVISDAVNLASRVEGLTKRYRVQLLISEQTLSRLRDPGRYSIRIIDRVKVKGKSEAVSVYEVFDADPPAVRDGKLRTKELFEQGYLLYQEQNFIGAKALFDECLRQNPDDKCAEVYVERCLHCLDFGYDEYWTNEGAKT